MTPETHRTGGGRWLIIIGFLAALLGSVGSLFLSLGMGLKACPLCFYQRSFMMSAMAVLAIGLVTDRGGLVRYGLAGIPIATAGLGVAAFHEYLVLSGALECPPGLFGVGTAPAQSLALFTVLTLTLVWGVLASGGRGGAVFAGMVLGLLLAWGSVASAPPLPPPPPDPYDPERHPLEMCRPPYQPGAEASGSAL